MTENAGLKGDFGNDGAELLRLWTRSEESDGSDPDGGSLSQSATDFLLPLLQCLLVMDSVSCPVDETTTTTTNNNQDEKQISNSNFLSSHRTNK